MFNLDEQIIKWRDRLEKSQSLETKDIDELENHLREEINELSKSKLSEEEIFLIATRRLGSINILADEYEKINHGTKMRNRISLIITGILIYLIAMFFAQYAAYGCIRLATKNSIRIDYVTLALIGFGAEVLAVMILLFCGYLAYRYLSKIHNCRRLINQMTASLTLLIFLIAVFIYRIGFHIPVPGFEFERIRDIQSHVNQALIYAQLLTSVLLPAVFVIILLGLDWRKVDN
jgi:hypothetical protein